MVNWPGMPGRPLILAKAYRDSLVPRSRQPKTPKTPKTKGATCRSTTPVSGISSAFRNNHSHTHTHIPRHGPEIPGFPFGIRCWEGGPFRGAGAK